MGGDVSGDRSYSGDGVEEFLIRQTPQPGPIHDLVAVADVDALAMLHPPNGNVVVHWIALRRPVHDRTIPLAAQEYISEYDYISGVRFYERASGSIPNVAIRSAKFLKRDHP